MSKSQCIDPRSQNPRSTINVDESTFRLYVYIAIPLISPGKQQINGISRSDLGFCIDFELRFRFRSITRLARAIASCENAMRLIRNDVARRGPPIDS